jgi:hypothetical protein
MKKLLSGSVRLFFMLLFLCCYIMSNAQDSAKAPSSKPVAKPLNSKPAVVKYPAKPYVKRTYPAVNAAAPAQGAVQPPAAYTTTPVSTDKSLNGQYQYVLSKIYHYQQPMIAALWHNINDTLKLANTKFRDANTKAVIQGVIIDSLQKAIKAKQQAIDDATNRRDEISILGMPLSKTAYNLVMWGLVLGLGVVLLVVILKTTGNSREAKYRTKLYEELSEEFQAYKAKANEKEKKLARELQTERNKVDELMGRG